MRRAILIAAAVLAAAVLVWRVGAGGSKETGGWRTVETTRGDLEIIVSCTGTLEPVTTVQVGTQVSGIVAAIGADFNDHVRAGQIIARIDTTLLGSAVRDAQANWQRARAELDHGDREYGRIAALNAEGLVSDTELSTALYARDSARASVKAAEVAVERARRNLNYATITSPIDGTVVARSVEEGQTVQASFTAPELFRIAGDLHQMRILAAVDESDIGSVKNGQTVRFTVQAYPDETFTGTVQQVRLQSTTQENVVNYTVVVSVANPDGRLLPGMTATLDILTATARDVVSVPNAALRFKPNEKLMAAWRQRREAAAEKRGGPGGPGGPGGGGHNGEGRPRDVVLLWYLDSAGQPDAMPVKVGLSDGTRTAITPLGERALEAGLQVIAGQTSAATPAAASNNPLQPQAQPGPRRGPALPGF